QIIICNLSTCHSGARPARLRRPLSHCTSGNALASIASCPACRDDRETPLVLGQDGRTMPVIWGGVKRYFRISEYYFRRSEGHLGPKAPAPSNSGAISYADPMKLGFEEAQKVYTSGSQSARAWTEAWVRAWAYCPHCGNAKMSQFPNNRPLA